MCIAILVAIIVGFTSYARRANQTTSQHSATGECRALSDLAVNLVMGQIRDATLYNTGTCAWASQPGAIRIWNGSGALERVYKLYSSREMQTDSLSFLQAGGGSADVPLDWATRPSEYVDINEPVAVTTSSGSRWTYPILNPAAIGKVDGFSSSQTQQNGIAWDTRASMPVRWLYLLQDGTIADKTAASQSNPIVGRLAFWTDDDCSKININTASATTTNTGPLVSSPAEKTLAQSETYWSVPFGYQTQEYWFGRSPPIQGEFNRYASHPASINLLAVFKAGTIPQIFDLMPRYKWGGSQNGSLWYKTYLSNLMDLYGGNLKRERLYDSIDELQFKPTLDAGTLVRGPNAVPSTLSGTAGTKIGAEILDQVRFFLTAHSRSPELNLFGQPRIALWPISLNGDDNHRTAFDKAIVLCSTLGSAANKKEYFFQRFYPLSQTQDWTDIPRNQSLFAYLGKLTTTNIPGFGGDFRTKYDAGDGGTGEWDQILTEIFDYIRSGVNLNETSPNLPSEFVGYTPFLEPPAGMTSLNDWLQKADVPGAGFVLPISLSQYGTRGAGRVPTLSEAAVAVVQKAVKTGTADDAPYDRELYSGMFFETFSPMLGFMPWDPKDFSLGANVTGGKIGVDGVSYDIFPNQQSGASTPFSSKSPATYNSASAGGIDGFSWLIPRTSNHVDFTAAYPFWRFNSTDKIPFPTSGTITLSSGTITLSSTSAEMSAAAVVTGSLCVGGTGYQVFSFEIPAFTQPAPEPIFSNTTTKTHASGTAVWIGTARKALNTVAFYNEDVVQGIEVRDGDFRTAAYFPDIPSSFFVPHSQFNQKKNAHMLRLGRYLRTNPGTMGSYVPLTFLDGVTNSATLPWSTDQFPGTFKPKIDPLITNLANSANSSADWDSGLAFYPDGPYLNKPDEGFRDIKENTPPYYDPYEWSRSSGFFSPTQQIPSAVMFGSLPTGVRHSYNFYKNGQGTPYLWRTLLFCPNPIIGGAHYGFTSPKDSLLLDFFNMPVVEPYVISEPFSSSGRINMNSQIVPFTMITRQTGLYAALSSQRVAAISNTTSIDYKNGSIQNNGDSKYRTRWVINIPETLKQFDNRFAPNGHSESGDLFHSASEICQLYLVPKSPESSPSLADMSTWWNDYKLTGNNLRERPYATLYPHLTTKSNVYTVHLRVQTLKKVPGTAANDFVENKDRILSEYRGEVTLERYIDNKDSRLGSTVDPDAQSLEPLYRFRIIQNKQFAP